MDSHKLLITDIASGLKSTDFKVRKNSVLFLSKIDKPEVIDLLSPLLNDPSEEIRLHCKKIIDFLSTKYNNSKELLLNDLLSEDIPQKRAAILKLKEYPSLEIITHLEKLFNHSDTSIRYFAKKSAAEIKSKLSGQSQSIIQTAGPINEKPPKKEISIENLENILSSTDVEKKLAILETIFTNQDASALPVIIEKINLETDGKIISSMIKLIGIFGGEAYLNTIVAFLNYKDTRIIANAIESLDIIGSKKTIPFLLPFLNNEDNRIKANSIKALSKFNQSEMLDTLEELIKSEQQWMLDSSIFVLGNIKNDKSVELLKRILYDERKELSDHALKTLSDINSPLAIKYISEFKNKGSVDSQKNKVIENLFADNHIKEKSLNIEKQTSQSNTISEISQQNDNIKNIEAINKEAQKKLLQMGIEYNVNKLNYYIENNNIKIVSLFIDSGINVNFTFDEGTTPLHIAVQGSSTEIVKLLIEKGANVDAKDSYGATPLHFATKAASIENAKVLIANGANINAIDNTARTPLHIAAFKNSKEITLLLVKNGANVNAIDNNVLTPLHIAVKKISPGTAQILIDNGANINAMDNTAQTPLHIAALTNSKEIVLLLVKNRANVDATDKSGWTPLHIAAKENFIGIAQVLIDNGANVNSIDNTARTPLHIAALTNSKEIALLLVKSRANVDAIDFMAWTPLHIAAKENSIGTVQVLINNGANVNAKNNKGVTPLNLSTNHEITMLLLNDSESSEFEASTLEIVNQLKSISFQLYGKKITFDEGQVKYNLFRKTYDKISDDFAIQYLEKYNGYDGIEVFSDNGLNDGFDLINKALQPALQLFVNLKIYDIDEKRFWNRYGESCLNDWNEAYNKINDQYLKIIMTSEDYNKHLTESRQNRGKWIGGGYGIEGAVKGALKAGAMNLVEGAAYGIFNLAASGINAISDSFQKSSLYNSEETKKTLHRGILYSVYRIHYSCCNVLNIPVPKEADINNANTIFNNLSRINQVDEKIENLLRILKMYPYNPEFYYYCIENFGDQNFQVEKMAKFFGMSVQIKKYKEILLSKVYQGKNLDNVVNALDAKQTIEKAMFDYGIKSNPILTEINDVLTKARTVDNIVFETHEEADLARNELLFIKKILKDEEYKKNEKNAQNCLKQIKEKASQTTVGQKYISEIITIINDFEIKARTIGIIEFKTLEESEKFKIDMPLIDKIIKGKNYLEDEEHSKICLFELKKTKFNTELGKMHIEIFEEIVADHDLKARTVNNKVYNTRQEAALARTVYEVPKIIIDGKSDKTEKEMTEIVKTLIENYNTVDLKKLIGQGCASIILIDASIKGHLEIIKLLLENGTNLNLLDKDINTALTIAEEKEHSKIIDLLKAKKILAYKNLKKELTITKRNKTEAEEQIENFYQECTEDLLSAADSGDFNKVKSLIEIGIDVNERGIHDRTALLKTCTDYGDPEECSKIAHFLIDNGADINAEDEYGWSVLIWACDKGNNGRNIKIIKLLLENGVDANKKGSKDGYSALWWACKNGYFDIVDLLISNGTDAISENNDHEKGWPILAWACENERIEIAKLLIQNEQTNINRVDDNHNTALLYAAKKGNAEIVKLLLENGAKINIQNKNGKTALILASENGHAEVVRMLVEKNANIEIQDKCGILKGWTALSIAEKKGHSEIIEILKSKKNECMQDPAGKVINNNEDDILKSQTEIKELLEHILKCNPENLHRAIKIECKEFIQVNNKIMSTISTINSIDPLLKELSIIDQKIKFINSLIISLNNENIKNAKKMLEICLDDKTPLNIKNNELISDLHKIKLEITSLNNDTGKKAVGMMEIIKRKANDAYIYGKIKIEEMKLKSKITEISNSILNTDKYKQLLFDETSIILKEIDNINKQINEQTNIINELKKSNLDICQRIRDNLAAVNIIVNVDYNINKSILSIKDHLLNLKTKLEQKYSELSTSIADTVRTIGKHDPTIYSFIDATIPKNKD